MQPGDHIHWFLTDRCNLDCNYCFRPFFGYSVDDKRNEDLARLLVEGGVKQVTLGGGEPMLVRNLETIFRILKEGSIYISLHTNGTFLSRKRITQLKGLVDDIALPVDSMNRKMQGEIKGNKEYKD